MKKCIYCEEKIKKKDIIVDDYCSEQCKYIDAEEKRIYNLKKNNIKKIASNINLIHADNIDDLFNLISDRCEIHFEETKITFPNVFIVVSVEESESNIEYDYEENSIIDYDFYKFDDVYILDEFLNIIEENKKN